MHHSLLSISKSEPQSNESWWIWWMCWFGLDISYANRKCTLCFVYLIFLLNIVFVLNSTSSVSFYNVCLHRVYKMFKFTSRMTLCFSVHLYRKLNSIKNDTLGNKFQIVLNSFYLLSTMCELWTSFDGFVYLYWINCQRLPFASSFLISHFFSVHIFFWLFPSSFVCLFLLSSKWCDSTFTMIFLYKNILH